MNATISAQQIENLRQEFREYLIAEHPKWSESTVAMHYSDAFYVFNNNIGLDFWACFTSEEKMAEARDRIHDYIFEEKQSSRAKERADSYSTSMKFLKLFLDSKYPTLAQEWSGSKVSDKYLKTAFQNWMKTQKKTDGEPYKTKTITLYINALKNATARLKLGNGTQTDLFCYTTSEDFKAAYTLITSAPNFNEVDKTTSNRSFSAGMALYAQFLEDMSEPTYWIFQGNPKYYDVLGYINDFDVISWSTNQYANQIKMGDRVYIWVSGSNGGIIAVGSVLCYPETRQPDSKDPYSRGEALHTEPYMAVDIQIEKRLTKNIILRSVLLADERTKKLGILKYPGATNYPVTNEQAVVIASIIDGTYKRVPVAKLVDQEKKRYWMYAPGRESRFWDEFYNSKIMGIGWDQLGDLSKYNTKESMRTKMKSLWGDERSYRNDAHATWQFANEVKTGDIVFVKRGFSKIIGRGRVSSEYIFDSSRTEYSNLHKVDWTHNGDWDHDGQLPQKTLTDITPYTDYCKRLEGLINPDEDLNPDDGPANYDSYTQDEFLNDVYMSEARYLTLKNLLLKKKNVILQGAPGVGKTYAAERLAYSIMGEKDTSRVKVIQFHQSYCYEDFIMGYRPNDAGFSLSKGPFYSFCKDAETDDREYFFIIDEINRGNLSKIFGELLMLIENDKRGKELRLLYQDEQFSVPENVHIIGMMNTADRSLAMIDYALRRRFAFFEIDPAFDSDGFKTYQSSIANNKFDALIDMVTAMNKAISEDASLGSGFRVGHSYFCTSDVIDDVWLSGVVEYELIPLIKEYWFDEPSKIEQWILNLRGAIHG